MNAAPTVGAKIVLNEDWPGRVAHIVPVQRVIEVDASLACASHGCQADFALIRVKVDSDVGHDLACTAGIKRLGRKWHHVGDGHASWTCLQEHVVAKLTAPAPPQEA